MVLRGGERHQLFLFFYPIVGAAMLLLLKWSVIQLVKLLPKVFVELLKREIPAFPTAFSTEDLCFLSEISDKKHYRRKIVIGNVAYIP